MPDVCGRDLLRPHSQTLFGAGDPKGGAVENGVRLYASPTCHHQPEVYGGLRESEAAGLLRAFFQGRR